MSLVILDYFTLPNNANMYRVSHNLWQSPGNWLQIANQDMYSNCEAIFEIPCLFSI